MTAYNDPVFIEVMVQEFCCMTKSTVCKNIILNIKVISLNGIFLVCDMNEKDKTCIFQFECIRHLNERTGEHIGILQLTKKKVKPKNSSVSNHLLFCYHSASFDDFSTRTS